MADRASHARQRGNSQAVRDLKKALGLAEPAWQEFLSHALVGFADFEWDWSIHPEPPERLEDVPPKWFSGFTTPRIRHHSCSQPGRGESGCARRTAFPDDLRPGSRPRDRPAAAARKPLVRHRTDHGAELSRSLTHLSTATAISLTPSRRGTRSQSHVLR